MVSVPFSSSNKNTKEIYTGHEQSVSSGETARELWVLKSGTVVANINHGGAEHVLEVRLSQKIPDEVTK